MEKESTTGSSVVWYSTPELYLAHRLGPYGSLAVCGAYIEVYGRYRGADDTKPKCGLCKEFGYK